ncbi:MAG TPA: Lrp/AsnC family transcriptional regulator [Caldimonas sp.]|nr:Lrp/AsnC family transcriptional regulator [Caldimonas sp.]
MDKIDKEILRLLQVDGRASFTDIGAAVHLSANAAADRVRRLIHDGAIVGIHAVVDPAALGLTIEAQIDVKLRATTSADDFERAIRDVPQVLTATLVTGSFDYALRVACSDRADLAELTETIRNKAGAQETYSRLILREVKVGAPALRGSAAKGKAKASSRRA